MEGLLSNIRGASCLSAARELSGKTKSLGKVPRPSARLDTVPRPSAYLDTASRPSACLDTVPRHNAMSSKCAFA